jgi:hypothetical protein
MCGCNKGSRNTGMPRNAGFRPRPRTNTTAAPTAAQLRALGVQNNTTQKSAAKLSEERRLIEKARRDAIRKKFNK